MKIGEIVALTGSTKEIRNLTETERSQIEKTET